MFWLQLLSNFIKVLRAGQTPRQIAGGFALGSLVGFSPILTLQGLLLWLIIFVLDVNLSAAFLAFTVFALIAYLLDPLFHELGYYLLVQVDGLRDFWTSLYNAPLAPLTRFNNTLVLGSLVGALLLSPFVYFAMKRFVTAYRTHLGARIEKWKVYQVVRNNKLVQWYQKIRSLGG
ncbi:MAG: TIGR03546 family protein [Ignavibacteriales bacterium]|nr:TIGR03546 family protein [Ignavibacteriales bacterium]